MDPLTLQQAGANHTNSGTVRVGVALRLSGFASSASPGSMEFAPGRSLTVSGGSFVEDGTLADSGSMSFSGTTRSEERGVGKECRFRGLQNPKTNESGNWSYSCVLTDRGKACNASLLKAGSLFYAAVSM